MEVNEESQYIILIKKLIEFEKLSYENIKYSPVACALNKLFPKKNFNELTLGQLSQITTLPDFTKEQMTMKVKELMSKDYIKTLIKRQTG